MQWRTRLRPGPRLITAHLLIVLLCMSLSKTAVCFQGNSLRISHAVTRSQRGWLGKMPPDQKLAQGKFLIAARQLRDPNFLRTVIFLIQYDLNGAVGVIINRPTDINVSTVLPDFKVLQQREDMIYWGGPVSINQLLLLVQADVQPADSSKVFENVYISSNPEVIEEMIINEDKGSHFRFYAGYAGWAFRQLEQEVKRGDWHILPAEADIIFNKTPTEIWPELILRSTVKYVDLFESRGKGRLKQNPKNNENQYADSGGR